MTLYASCLALGLEMDHRESDLYVRDCQQIRELLTSHGIKSSLFTSDGNLWHDIPFQYTPYWSEKCTR